MKGVVTMANGDIHKLGTLYVANQKKARPTKPWCSTNGSASSTGNLFDYGNSTSNAVEIRDTDPTASYQLQWIEVNVDGEKLLICDRNILCNITWNRLNALGFCSAKGSGKTITIDGQQYELFMLTGGVSSSTQTEASYSNEWDRIIGNLGGFSGLPTPASQDLANSSSSANFSTAHNKIWNWAGCYSWCQNVTNNGSSYRALRGYVGARYWLYINSDVYSYFYGWRPALRVLNAAPQISPASTNYGSVKTAPSIAVKVTDEDGDSISGTVKLDGTQKDTFSGEAGNATYEVPLGTWWGELSLEQHKVTIEVCDTNNGVATAEYTFTKTNAPAGTPTIINPVTGERRPKDFYVEFVIGEDAENDPQKFKVQACEQETFSDSVKEFTSVEKLEGDSWVPSDTATNEDLGKTFRISVTGIEKDCYIRVVSTDTGSENAVNSAHVRVSIGDVLQIQTKPAVMSNRPTAITIILKSNIDSRATTDIKVCNNAKDDIPMWEDYAVSDDGSYVFANTIKIADSWAVSAKVTVTANNATEEISISAIGLGVI